MEKSASHTAGLVGRAQTREDATTLPMIMMQTIYVVPLLIK